MDSIMNQKKFQYLDHLTRHLEQNNERIRIEKETLRKMEMSFNQIKPKFKDALELQLKSIEN
jgi:hypothetical protein